MDDVFRGAFRPRGLYPAKHSGRRKRKGKSVGIPEIGEEIGKRIPGAKEIKGRTFGDVERRLWMLDGIAQRALYFIMVADVITDFVFDWTNGIYDTGYCTKRGQSAAAVAGWFGASPFPYYFGTTDLIYGGGGNLFRLNAFTNQANNIGLIWSQGASAMANWTVTCGAGTDFTGRFYLGGFKRVTERIVTVAAHSEREFTMSLSGDPGAVTAGFEPLNEGCVFMCKLNVLSFIGSGSAPAGWNPLPGYSDP